MTLKQIIEKAEKMLIRIEDAETAEEKQQAALAWSLCQEGLKRDIKKALVADLREVAEYAAAEARYSRNCAISDATQELPDGISRLILQQLRDI